MSVNKYDSTNDSLVTLAGGQRLWVGTKSAHDAAVAAGTMPNNCCVAIIDDYPAEATDDFSLDEVRTNRKWIDGKWIYKKVVDNIPFPEEADIEQAAGKVAISNYDLSSIIPNVDTLIRGECIVKGLNDGGRFTLPRNWGTIDTISGDSMVVNINASVCKDQDSLCPWRVEVVSNRKAWNNTNYKVIAIIEYTKTTD